MSKSIAFNLLILAVSATNIVFSLYLAIQLYLGHYDQALQIQSVLVMTAICLSYSFLSRKN